MKDFSPWWQFWGCVHEAFVPTRRHFLAGHYIEEIPIHYIGEISLQYIGEISLQSSLGRNERISRDMLLVADLQGVATKKQLTKIDKISKQNSLQFWLKVATFWTSPIFCSRIGSEGWKWKQMRLQHTQLCNMLIDRKYSIWLLCFSLLFTKCFPAIIAFACCQICHLL